METFACWWGLLLTSTFLILEYYRSLFFLFTLAFLKVIILVLISSITLHQYHRHNFNIRLSAYDFCMPASLLFNLTMTTCWPLYSTSSKQSLRFMCFNATISNYHKPLYNTVWGFWHGNMLSSYLWSLLANFLWFSVCFVYVFHIVQNVKTNKNDINYSACYIYFLSVVTRKCFFFFHFKTSTSWCFSLFNWKLVFPTTTVLCKCLRFFIKFHFKAMKTWLQIPT